MWQTLTTLNYRKTFTHQDIFKEIGIQRVSPARETGFESRYIFFYFLNIYYMTDS
jgi:hypothetical protein